MRVIDSRVMNLEELRLEPFSPGCAFARAAVRTATRYCPSPNHPGEDRMDGAVP
jgi:hypothetical protein